MSEWGTTRRSITAGVNSTDPCESSLRIGCCQSFVPIELTEGALMASVQADLDTLRSLYNTLKGNTESCANIRTSTDSSLASTVWESKNADEFRSAWSDTHKPNLIKVEQALAAAATDVAPNHNNLVIANGEDDEHLAPVQPSA
jgi:hypothetical protein